MRHKIKRSNHRLLAGMLVLAATGCERPPAQAHKPVETEPVGATTSWTLSIQPVRSPATGTATSPQLTVGAGRPIVSWLETANFRRTLKFPERTSAGWSEPQAVISGKGVVTNPADVPSVRALADGTLVAHWNQQYDDDDEENYSLLVSWSTDRGRTWAQPVRPHHDSTKTEHGFGSLFQSPGGGFGVVWLDGRATRPNASENANNMGLWAALYNSDRRQMNEVAIDSRVCDCCQTAVAETSDGVVVAYRGRSAGEVRDILITRLVNGQWSGPAPVHTDGWKINGCPVNGPALDAGYGKLAVAWFTGATGDGRSFVAFSDDGHTFSAPIRVDDGRTTGHMDVALLSDGSAAASWTAADNGHSQFKVRRIDPTGQRSAAVTIAQVVGAEYPRLAPGHDELLFAWSETEDGYSRVRTARAPMPVAPAPHK